MIFLMISTRKSQSFTSPSLSSLLKKTTFRSHDKVIIIDNDGSLQDLPGSIIIRHERPRSFAENANFGIGISHILKDDLILLNNDIIYTNNWLDFLLTNDGQGILIPFCNQNVQYSAGSLKIQFAMDYEDYADREDELEEIARNHRLGLVDRSDCSETDILMSFFCVYIPWRVSILVGNFDERFGRGGGEDVDYRLRALKCGIGVLYSPRSYLLHFMGKSTWRSGETIDDTRSADANYRRYFVEKWGGPVAEFFLAGPNKDDVANRYCVLPHLERRDFRAVLEHLEDAVSRKGN